MRSPSFSARCTAAMAKCGGRCPIEAGRPRPARRPRVPPRPTPVRPNPAVRVLARGGRGRGRAGAVSRAAVRQASRRVNDRQPDITNVTKEEIIMRDIATADPVRQPDLRRRAAARFPRAPRWRACGWPAGRADGAGRSGSSGRTTSPSRSTGRSQARAPSALVKARASWSTASSIGGNGPTRRLNRREAVVLRARQILFEGPRSTPQTGADQRDGDVSPTSNRVSRPRRFRRRGPTTCRSDPTTQASGPSARGRARRKPAARHGFFFALRGRSSTSGTSTAAVKASHAAEQDDAPMEHREPPSAPFGSRAGYPPGAPTCSTRRSGVPRRPGHVWACGRVLLVERDEHPHELGRSDHP